MINTMTIAWIALPFFAGFNIYLLPRLARFLAVVVPIVSLGYGLQRLFDPFPLTLRLLDHFGD
jgi:multicomponent Na+:H+ antiporter subunit D